MDDEEQARRKRRSATLVARYGVTADEWDGVLAHQGGGCAVCGKPAPGKRNLHTDHDHATGLFRGILCWRCNNILLRRGITPDLLRAAAAYLEAPPAVEVLGPRFGTKGPVVKRRRRRRK